MKRHTQLRTYPICAVMARKSSLFQSSERPLVLEEVLKWLEEVLNLPPNV